MSFSRRPVEKARNCTRGQQAGQEQRQGRRHLLAIYRVGHARQCAATAARGWRGQAERRWRVAPALIKLEACSAIDQTRACSASPDHAGLGGAPTRVEASNPDLFHAIDSRGAC
jgi:hypothetical protein